MTLHRLPFIALFLIAVAWPVAGLARGGGTGPCQTDLDCDDGNPCTDEVCLEQKCVRSAPAVGPLCDDGNDCTLGDQCFEGACKGMSEVTLLSGAQLPAAEGWSLYGHAGADSTNGSTVTIDTASLPAPKPSAMFAKAVPASVFQTHDLEWSLTVQSATHNPFDASAALLPAFTGPTYYGANNERPQMIYFEEDHIGWGDQSQSYNVNNLITRSFRLHITPTGQAKVYVDGNYALTRPGMVLNGTIGFGDQTNDTGVDGRFEIAKMRLVPNAFCK